MGETIEDRLANEADLCRNEGADDIAELLDEAREAIYKLKQESRNTWQPSTAIPDEIHPELVDLQDLIFNPTMDAGIELHKRIAVILAERDALRRRLA